MWTESHSHLLFPLMEGVTVVLSGTERACPSLHGVAVCSGAAAPAPSSPLGSEVWCSGARKGLHDFKENKLLKKDLSGKT